MNIKAIAFPEQKTPTSFFEKLFGNKKTLSDYARSEPGLVSGELVEELISKGKIPEVFKEYAGVIFLQDIYTLSLNYSDGYSVQNAGSGYKYIFWREDEMRWQVTLAPADDTPITNLRTYEGARRPGFAFAVFDN